MRIGEGLRRITLGVLGAAWLTAPAVAAELPAAPQLRLETGMHTEVIRRIGVDATGRLLVTASRDKTVRLWELPKGRLLRVLRPPIGDGNDGKLYAVTLSPDGRTVACGGFTGAADEPKSIYLFDAPSGRLVRRIGGLPEAVNHLAYSADGRWLVATLGGGHGIRVYRTGDYAQVAQDQRYGSASHGADFDRQGRLVTSSWDGYLRLYSPTFQLLAKARAPGGVQPLQVSFSPDGAKVAVGFADSPQVNVLSAGNLALLYAPDTREVSPEQRLSSVAWSADGRTLYAGGTFARNDTIVVRAWSEEGRGAAMDVPAAGNSIQHLLPLNEGGVVYATYDPAFGALDAAGQRTLFVGPSTADYRAVFEGGFLVSADGGTVRFGYEFQGRAPARFSIATRVLETDPPPDGTLAAPVTGAPGLEVTGWQDTTAPRLNGRPLPLEPAERARSLALAPGGFIFLGTEWYLRVFDRTGQPRWAVPLPGAAWGVNVTGNGRMVVAALADGTLRWYRLRDGKELLAFFPHADRKRWVLWTPTGYYDTSPGGEDLIGWHRNNGRDAEADFFPVGQFRSVFYRPDVVARVLDTLDESEALRLANAEAGRQPPDVALGQRLPPVVTIHSPVDGTEVNQSEILVRFTVRSPSGEPVTAVKALVDGRPLATTRDIKVQGRKPGVEPEAKELRVTIPPRDTEIGIIAENRFATSQPATVRVMWRGPNPEEFVVKPTLYVLAVGVSQYENKEWALGLAAKDAQDFVATIQKQKGGLYRDVVAKVLTDAQATKDGILDGLEWIQRETTAKDVAMVFLAGHGVNDPSGTYYFLPVNADTEKLKRTGVIFADILATVHALAGKTLVFLDTCHSGNIMGMRRGVADITGVVNELASAESGAVVFASSTGRQYSQERPEWGNGAFTKALLEGLDGKADFLGKGKITVNMLDAWLADRVKELTQGTQTPTTSKPKTVPDFPIALRP
ncbi:caspase family protein [Nitrospira sp. Kam-Ns4a]